VCEVFFLASLRQVRRSLDVESVKTLVHAFVTTRLDYYNSVLAGAPRSVTDKLQRALNAAARLVSGTRKFDRGLSRLLHVDLHWLDVPERVQYKLGITVHRCQQHKAPQYLTDCVTPAADSDYALPVVTNFLCCVTNSAHLVVGPLLLLDQWLGIRCRPTSVIWRVVTSLSDDHWTHFCSLSTSVSSILEVLYDDALYKLTLSVWLSVYLSICRESEVQRQK